MVLAAFANMETVRLVACALPLETTGMPESGFAALPDCEAVSDKYDSFYQPRT